MSAYFLASKTVRTRKWHRCNWCPDPIGAGRPAEVMIHVVNKWGEKPRIVRSYAHPLCQRLLNGEVSESGDNDRTFECEPHPEWMPNYVAYFGAASEAVTYITCSCNDGRGCDEPEAITRVLRWATDGTEPAGIPMPGSGVPVPMWAAMPDVTGREVLP